MHSWARGDAITTLSARKDVWGLHTAPRLRGCDGDIRGVKERICRLSILVRQSTAVARGASD